MIILIAGIHAVGKSYLAGPLAQSLGMRHATASQLIREQRGMETWGNDKKVEDADANQAALIAAVRRIRDNGETLLLDGHFMLRGVSGGFIAIDESVFRDLGVDAVLLLEADAGVVLDRLHARGDDSWSISELEKFATMEADRARSVASSIQIPFRLLISPSQDAFKDAVLSLQREARSR